MLINSEKETKATTLKVEEVEATILLIFKVTNNTINPRINHRATTLSFPFNPLPQGHDVKSVAKWVIWLLIAITKWTMLFKVSIYQQKWQQW